MKRCSVCGERLLDGDFHANPRTRDGLASCCKKCQRKSKRRSTRLRPEPGLGVVCRVCGDDFHSLFSHLRIHGLTARQYRERFPGAPTQTEDHALAMRERRIDQHGSPRWDAPQIIAAIQRFVDKNGALPTANAWRSARRTHPCGYQVRHVFGSWNKAIEAAGFTPRAQGWRTYNEGRV